MACYLGCEGIVSKRLGSPYRSSRSPDWLKMKNPASARAGLECRATFLGCRARSDAKVHFLRSSRLGTRTQSTRPRARPGRSAPPRP
jgi:ATP-dependent DNA ligase